MSFQCDKQWVIDSLNFISSEIYEAQKKYFAENRSDQRLPRVIIHCGPKHCEAVIRLLSEFGQAPAQPLVLQGAKIHRVIGSGDFYFNIQAVPEVGL